VFSSKLKKFIPIGGKPSYLYLKIDESSEDQHPDLVNGIISRETELVVPSLKLGFIKTPQQNGELTNLPQFRGGTKIQSPQNNLDTILRSSLKDYSSSRFSGLG
jgi:hypothetical protein